jgi:hypothetical protein
VVNQHFKSATDISATRPAHLRTDSGYATESPAKKLNPAASEFKSAPAVVQGGKANHPRQHVNNVFPQQEISGSVPMPAGLPPMKPFGMPFDSDKTSGSNDSASPTNYPGNSGFLGPYPGMMPPPFLLNVNNASLPMPPFPPAPFGNFGNFNGFPPFPPMMPMEPQMFNNNNNGGHFNTFPNRNTAPPFMPPPAGLPGRLLAPQLSANLPAIPPLAPTGPSIPSAVPMHPFSNPVNPAVVPAPAPAVSGTAPAPPPYFPVTKKPRDNDPVKQQKYEEFLEWRKMNEPGFHLAAKQRQANRFLRQRGATQSESAAGADGPVSNGGSA